MTITVNLHTEQEEKVILAFLDSLQYDYQTDGKGIYLTLEQQKEVLARDKEFIEGKTTARDWSDIKKEMERVYR